LRFAITINQTVRHLNFPAIAGQHGFVKVNPSGRRAGSLYRRDRNKVKRTVEADKIDYCIDKTVPQYYQNVKKTSGISGSIVISEVIKPNRFTVFCISDSENELFFCFDVNRGKTLIKKAMFYQFGSY
jgi:hypothetical protein